MNELQLPRMLNFGAGQMAEISYLEDIFGISRKSARALLHRMHIEPIYVGKETYFSLPTFQKILYVLTKPGGKGFMFPGAAPRPNDTRLKEVTDDIIAEAESPETLAAMTSVDQPDTLILRKMLDLRGKQMMLEGKKNG